MRARGVRRGIVGVAAAALLCGSGLAAADRDDAVRAKLEAAWARHIDAAVRNDLEGVMEIYASDVAYEAPGGETVHGADKVRELERAALARGRVVAAAHTTRAVQVAGDTAYELGTVRGPVAVGDEPPQEVIYHFMARWRRDDAGRWRIQYLVGEGDTVDGP